MKFKLTITPALEVTSSCMTTHFETAEQMMTAKDTCANLLLFLQEDLDVLPDYSNMFVMEEYIDGEWEEYEEF